MATGWEGQWLQFIHIYDNELAILGVSSTDELCDDCEGGGSNGKEEEGDKCDLDRVLLQPMLLMKLLNCSFMHTALIGITEYLELGTGATSYNT